MKRTQRVTFGNTKNASRESAQRPQSGSHVITLCSVPVPITISRPRSPLLARFTFFSTRRQDRWCDSYWVHLGYFSTRAEAQRWATILLRHYPNAFVHETRKLIPPSATGKQDWTCTRNLRMDVDVDGPGQLRTALNTRFHLN